MHAVCEVVLGLYGAAMAGGTLPLSLEEMSVWLCGETFSRGLGEHILQLLQDRMVLIPQMGQQLPAPVKVIPNIRICFIPEELVHEPDGR